MVKVALAQINSTVGDLAGNAQKIIDACRHAAAQGADIVLTPEFSLVGYPPEDLLLRETFYAHVEVALEQLAQALSQFPDCYVVVGHPSRHEGLRFNTASVLVHGAVLCRYHKYALPNDGVFDEKRYFSSSDQPCVWTVKGVSFGINICEDTWSSHAPLQASQAGAQVLLVLNGSPYHRDKQSIRYQCMRDNVTALGLSVVYVNLVGGQDELIFDGNSFVMDAHGDICAQLKH